MFARRLTAVRWGKYSVAAISVMFWSPPVFGVTVDIIPRQQVNAQLTGTSSTERPELAGQVIQTFSSDYTTDIGSTPGLVATLNQEIVRADAGGTLDFYAWVTVAPQSAITLTDFSVRSFPAESLDVDFRADLPGDAAPNSVLIDGTDFYVLFNFAIDPIAPGETSDRVLIRTNATDFSIDGFSLASGYQDATTGSGLSRARADAVAAAPASVTVPLPSAGIPGAVILAGGAVLLAGARARSATFPRS